MGAVALGAALGDGHAWRNDREFAASLGLCPSHTGTGVDGPQQATRRPLSAHGAHCRAACCRGQKELLGVVAGVAFTLTNQRGRRRPGQQAAQTAWALIAHNRTYDMQG